MQSINITVINRSFMAVFLGTAAAGIFLAFCSLSRWHQPGVPYSILGALLYLFGTVGVTMLCNVPLNDALAKVDPGSTEGTRLSASYLANWTLWNHVRTAAAIAAASFTIALCDRAGRS